MRAYERFLKYISYDTQSEAESKTVPSTEKQLKLAEELKRELTELGAEDVILADTGIVYGVIPASSGAEDRPALCLNAHMDTAPASSGSNIKPRIINNYDGSDIVLNEELGIVTRVSEYPVMNSYIGEDLIVTDGTTLLGADDKAGVAEIMTLCERLLSDKSLPHPKLKIMFTPDEEIGRGADNVDYKRLGAAYGYTVDGEAIDEFSYENFNAASAVISISGISAHTGAAKGVMKNALLMGMEFNSMLPEFDRPEYTEGYEGFYHLDNMSGTVESAKLEYIIRDHSKEKFEKRKEYIASVVEFLNKKYGYDAFKAEIKDTYYNMLEKISDYRELIDNAFEALRESGIDAKAVATRGGTDGARMSWEGLPCPNLGTGGANCHGRHECISVQKMDKMTEVLERLVAKFA